MYISFTQEKLVIFFSAFPASSAGSSWPLAQNNPYAKEAHFGGAYSVTLQGQGF